MSSPKHSGTLLGFNLYLGLALFLLFAWLLSMDVSFVKTWYYCLAWWSLILVLDSINFRRFGLSPLSRSPRIFARTAFLSVGIWLIFEVFNLRLRNWSYHDLPPDIPLRWLGYSLAFSTVVPALRELALLFIGPDRRVETSDPAWNPSLRSSVGLTCVGGLLLLLAVLAPRLFFPLVWLGFIPLLEPWNARSGEGSLWAERNPARWKNIRGWLLAGLTAGLFWEGLNFWAGSHWEYHLPYLDFWRVFQMPVFGFGGFLPFALEVFALSVFLNRLWEKAVRNPQGRWIVPVLCLALYGWIFHLMDIFTVIR